MAIGEMEAKLIKYLNYMKKVDGSDLHIKATAIARGRVKGSLVKFGKSGFSKDEMDQLAREILTKVQYTELVENRTLDFTFIIGKTGRYRGNMFYQLDGLSAVFRVIPLDIPSMKDLNLPPVLYEFTKVHRGLVLVTGVTGSGKSTTLAAILNEINETRADHLITVEDPIEFIHPDKMCLVNQRGVGQDAISFGSALKGALREDPDIILVGEMRDLETIEIGLHAASTGHLVFSTLHSINAKDTIDRMMGTFPPLEQPRIRKALSATLEGIVAQRLVKTLDGGRAAAIEIYKRTPRIEQLVAEGRDSEIGDALAEGKDTYGTQTFDQALLDIFYAGRMGMEALMENATSPSDVKLQLELNGYLDEKGEDGKPKGPEFFEFKAEPEDEEEE